MLKSSTIVFDLDGTLVDTAPDLIGAAQAMLARIGRPPAPPAPLRPLIGAGGKAILCAALEATGGPVSEAHLEKMVAGFLVHYEANIAVESRVFPGTIEALDGLEAAGARLAVCTNKPEGLALKLLETLGLRDRFACVIGRGTIPQRKPAPEPIREAVIRAGGSLERALMVGDSLTDVTAANATGVPCIVVDFGYFDAPPREMGAARVISHFEALIPACEAVLAAPAKSASSA